MQKILYINDFKETGSIHVNALLGLCKIGVEEILYLYSERIEELERAASADGLRATKVICKGPYLSEILDTADREKVSVAAVCRDKGSDGAFNDRFLKKLLKKSPVPVFVFNKTVALAQPVIADLFHHVVFATDWTQGSKAALEYLMFNFKEVINVLEIVHVIDTRLTVRDIRNLKKKLEETRNLFLQAGIDAESHIYAGKPSEEIILAAKDYGATSIVMGNSYSSHIKSIFTKNVVFRVATWTDVPSLFVPPSPYPDQSTGRK